MKKYVRVLLPLCCSLFFFPQAVFGQCSVCARTTEQMDPSAAQDFNFAVVYLMVIPLAIIGVIGYLWYRRTHVVS